MGGWHVHMSFGSPESLLVQPGYFARLLLEWRSDYEAVDIVLGDYWILILELIRVWLWGEAAIVILSHSITFFFHPHNPWGAPPTSLKLPVVLSMALFLAEMFHIQQNTTCLKWESSHLIAPTAAEKKRERKRKKEKKGGAETGLVLMTDNPVTNSWSSSKGWLSRLWLCDVNGTWSSGSAEAQRKGSQFSLRLPQTCPLLWYSSTHFDSKLSGLLSLFFFFFFD